MKVLKTLSLFSIAIFPFISSYSQCAVCTITNPADLPAVIPPGTVICITTNKTYGSATDLTGGSIHVCSGATLRLNGAVSLDAHSEITTTGCSRVEIHGNIHNLNPIGLKVIDNCNCAGSITSTGPIFGFGVVCGPLPVELISFNAELQKGNQVDLSWSTATEINNSHFVLDRSTDLINWEMVTEVAGAGNSNQIKSYSVTDILSNTGTYYYRLTQVDYDGKSETFDYRTVTCHSMEAAVEVNFYPNPATDYVIMNLNGQVDADLTVSIMNLSGQVVFSSVIAKGSAREQRLDLAGLGSGVYVIHVNGGSLSQSSKLMIR